MYRLSQAKTALPRTSLICQSSPVMPSPGSGCWHRTPLWRSRNSFWGNFHQRLYYHNVLRAYLDQRLLPALQGELESCLGAVEPARWLPFAFDRHLKAWRDLLAPQFHPGAAARTVEVFAARQGIPIAEYDALLNSDARMQTEIFSHLSYQQIEAYRQRLLVESAHLVESYLAVVIRSAHPAGLSRVALPATPACRQKEHHL